MTNAEKQKELDKRADEAANLLQDESKMEEFLLRLERKMDKIPALGDKLSYVPKFVLLIRSYMKKEYTKIPIGSLIAIVGSLLYFVSPIDLIPDTIPVVGYIDDAGILAFAFSLVKDDLDEYFEWRKSNGKE